MSTNNIDITDIALTTDISKVAHRLQIIFAKARANGVKWPKLHLGTALNLQLSINRKGQINITNAVAYSDPANKWYGRVTEDCQLQLSKSNAYEDIAVIKLQLTAFTDNQVSYAKHFAKATHKCMYCGLTLTNAISIYHGYGPICAENYGLPWEGEKVAATPEQIVVQDVLQLRGECDG